MSTDRSDELAAAIRARDVEKVRALLAAGAAANAMIGGEVPLLVLAADTDDVHIVGALLDAGAAINACSVSERTSMFHDDTYTQNEENALELAAMRDKRAVAELLLERGAEHVEALEKAVEHRRLEIARMLVAKASDHSKRAALGIAAMGGQLAAMALLIEHKTDVNAPGYRGVTPLLTAIECGRLEAARALMDAGARPPRSEDLAVTLRRSLALHQEGAKEVARALGLAVPTIKR